MDMFREEMGMFNETTTDDRKKELTELFDKMGELRKEINNKMETVDAEWRRILKDEVNALGFDFIEEDRAVAELTMEVEADMQKEDTVLQMAGLENFMETSDASEPRKTYQKKVDKANKHFQSLSREDFLNQKIEAAFSGTKLNDSKILEELENEKTRIECKLKKEKYEGRFFRYGNSFLVVDSVKTNENPKNTTQPDKVSFCINTTTFTNNANSVPVFLNATQEIFMNDLKGWCEITEEEFTKHKKDFLASLITRFKC